ncbi:MAG: tetratricopeptide repeat protein [Myxococcota bacterium]
MFSSINTRSTGCQLSTRTACDKTGRGTSELTLHRLLIALALSAISLGCGGDIETRMAEVRVLQDVGQFTASIDELREILAVSPELPEANYRLGVALHQTGNPSRAVWALQKASETPDYQIPATLLLASVQFNLNNYEESIRSANRVLEIDPKRGVALQIRSKANLAIHALDEALADTTRLLELAPDDYMNLVVHATVLAEMGRMDEAEAAQFLVKQRAEASGDPQTASRGCLAPALFAKQDLKDMDRAEELYEDCASKYPDDAFVIPLIVSFLDSIDKPDRGTELIQKAVEAAPESLALRSTLAARLSAAGENEQAEAVLLEAVNSFGSAAAWNLLVGYHRHMGNPDKALEAIDKVIELTGGGSDLIRFSQADLLIDLGDLDQAEQVAQGLDEPTYTKMLWGRIQLVRGNAKEALAAFDEGIANWPNNAGARYLAGAAALQLGDFERAIVEFRESVRVDVTATDAARSLARLYFERGDYEQAINFASVAMKNKFPNQRDKDLMLAARAFAAIGDFENARIATRTLSQLPGHEADGAAELATVERLASGPAAAVDAIEGLGLDLSQPGNEVALRAWAQHLALDGRAAEAVTRVGSIVTEHPNSASLITLYGVTLSRTGQTDEARAEFERALGIDPESAESLAGLGTIFGQQGDTEKAIALFDQATAIDQDTGHYPYAAAQLLLRTGNRADATARLRTIVRNFPGHAEARNDLAWTLAEAGEELDLALRLAEEASRLNPEPDILDTLGFVYMKRGESSAAVAVLEKAIASDEPSPSIRYRLGTALSQTGDTQRARKMLSDALEAGPFPEADEARRQLAQLDQR